MTHAIVHPRVSTVADGSDPNLIKPSDWNASHSINWGFATPNVSVITSAMADVAGDPYFDKVSLLLHCDGVDLSTTIVDNSPNPKAVTAAETAKIRTSFDGVNPKFGSGKAFFDGSTSYLSVADHADMDLGSLFTIEGWVRFVSTPTDGSRMGFVMRWDGVNAKRSYHFTLNNIAGTLTLQGAISPDGTSPSTVSAGAAWTPSLDTWYHLAFCHTGTALKIFVNGVELASTSTTLAAFATDTAVYVGSDWVAPTAVLDGYMDDIRITKGLARYTANFTPPAISHPDSFPGVNLVAGRNYTSTGPIEIQDTDVNIPNGTEWVIV